MNRIELAYAKRGSRRQAQVNEGEAMNFEWHPAKAEINLAKHGVSFKEAQETFDDENGIVFPDEIHSEGESRFRLLGASQLHLLVVTYTLRMDENGHEIIRLISARQAERWEKRQYYEF